MTWNNWPDTPRGFMDFRESIKDWEGHNDFLPDVRLCNHKPRIGVFPLSQRGQSTTKEPREVASESLGSLIIAEIAYSEDLPMNQGTSQRFVDNFVAFIIQFISKK